jgi:hypothetical protein
MPTQTPNTFCLEDKYNILRNNFSEALHRIAALENIVQLYESQTQKEAFDLLKEGNSTPTSHQPSLRIGESRLGGRGVFAQTKIPKGSVIEITPFIVCFRQSLDNTPLSDYYFTLEDEGQVLGAVPMGFGMLYNHSDEAAAHWILDIERKEILFLANKDIEVDEEITINYGEAYWKSLRKEHKIV